ncbi:MAG: hypothetical protein H7Z43_02200 [Clostridia bacterium]|nr:hypothetical protein [Deltaproteobacteria bacterium]
MDVSKLPFEIFAQPDETTCGPTCLHAVYRYYDDQLDLRQLINEVPSLSSGGTYAVHLATHALRRGYPVRLYTYNLQVFDPTWFVKGADIAKKLAARSEFVKSADLKMACATYLQFLAMGGEIRWKDLTPGLIRKYISRRQPIITGLSATYLYQSAREFGFGHDYDDVRGDPVGHFVVLTGYDSETRNVFVADPFKLNPYSEVQQYAVNIDRVLCSILLGVLTYDANLVVIRSKAPPSREEVTAVKSRPMGARGLK